MANNLDTATLLSIAKNRNKLMKLAEGIKTRKKPSNKRSLNLKRDPAYTNIEHLVFGTYRPRSSTPDDHSRKNPPPDGGRRQVSGANPELVLRADKQSDTAITADGAENMSPHRKAAQSNVSSPIADDKAVDAPERRASIPLQCISDKENMDYSQESRTNTHDKCAIDSEKTDTENLEPMWNIADDMLTNSSINVKHESLPTPNQRLPPHRWKEKLHNTSLPVTTNDSVSQNECNDKFVRQNTYPSGIPRPRIHVKHNLAPMRNPLPKSSQQPKGPPLVKSTPVRHDAKVLDQRKSLSDEKPGSRSIPAVRSTVRCTTNSNKTTLSDAKGKSSSKSSLSSSHSSLSGGKVTVNQTNKKNESVTRSGFTRSQSYCKSTDKTIKTNGIVPSQVRKTVQRQTAQNRQASQTTRSVVRHRPLPTDERKEKDVVVTTTSTGIQQNKSVKTPSSDPPRSIPRFQAETTKKNAKESGLPVRSTQNGFRRTVRSVSVDSGRLIGPMSLHFSPIGNGQVKYATDSKVARPFLKKSSTVDIGALSHKNTVSNESRVSCPKSFQSEKSEGCVRVECNQLMSDIDEKDEKSSSGTSKSPSEDRPQNVGISRRSASLPKSFLLEKYGLNGKKLTPTKTNDSLGLERLLHVGEGSQVSETPAPIRRRAASTSESSPKIKPPPRPHSDVGSSLNGNSSVVEAFMAQLSRQRDTVPELKRHSSDSGTPLRKTPSVERQLSTPSFIKIRSDKSRPLKRNRGQSRLRRSISQPLDLEKIGLATKTTGYSDHEGSHDISTASSEDDFSSDGESYTNSQTPSRGQPIFREFSDDGVTYAEALWDHVTIDAEELAFHAGEVIEVTDSSDKDWWWGSIGPRSGWFPAAFVRLRVNQEDTVEDCISKMGDGTLLRQPPRKMSVSLLSNEQVRANVVKEIFSTEQDFVQHLKDVVEGYLRQVRRRSDMFSDDRVATIFGNIEAIYQFQSNFLEHLEACIDVDRPHLSQIGNCFLEHKEEFEIYSEYCNNHPLAVSELQELYADSKYIHFFEACRLLQEMIDISLDGFLLTPVQKICKYPLQLAELLKYTKADHQDFQPVTKALAAMREVAQLVNERKRRMECLERLIEWQQTIDGWEGPDLIDTCSLMIYSGEVIRATSAWSRDIIHLFLFDHLLVYCKKDLLKRNTYVYKGRIDLTDSCMINLEDGKDSQFGITVRNAWKVYCSARDKWFLFYTKTSLEKDHWLKAFEDECMRVHEDKLQGYIVTEEAKKAARLALVNKSKPKRPRAKLPKGSRPHPDTAVAELLLDPPAPKSRTGSLPSNLHPSVAVTTSSTHGPPKKKGSGWFHFGSSKKPKK